VLSESDLSQWEAEAKASASLEPEKVLGLIGEVRRLRGVIEDALPQVGKLVEAYGKVAAVSLEGLLENVRLKSSKHGPTQN
jgi:hypothetical protein